MLQLRVTTVYGRPAAGQITAEFGPQGGTIGRNPGTTLMLPDDTRTVSRQQASIVYREAQFFFEQQGANPSLINGQPIAVGAAVALRLGDQLGIGAYTLTVSCMVLPDASPPDLPISSDRMEPTPSFMPSLISPQQTLLLAFCEGLGLELDLADGLNETFMYQLGGLLREAVQGTMALLGPPAENLTNAAAAQHNNPLYCAPNRAAALTLLLSGKNAPEFLPPVTAMRAAQTALKHQQTSNLCGTDLRQLLEQFSPAQLEQRIAATDLIGTMLPAARKHQLWERYSALYPALASQLLDDYQPVVTTPPRL